MSTGFRQEFTDCYQSLPNKYSSSYILPVSTPKARFLVNDAAAFTAMSSFTLKKGGDSLRIGCVADGWVLLLFIMSMCISIDARSAFNLPVPFICISPTRNGAVDSRVEFSSVRNFMIK